MTLLLSLVLAASGHPTIERDFPTAQFLVRPDESTVSMAIGLDAQLGEVSEATARTFLFTYAGAFGLGGEDDVRLLSQRSDAQLTTLRFERSKAGVVVDGAELVMTFDAKSRLVMVHAGAQVLPAKGRWRLPSSHALTAEPGATQVTAAWVRHGDTLRPAWVVTKSQPDGTLVWASVDAETGEALERRRITWSVDGAVQDFSPVRSIAGLCPQRVDGGYETCATASSRTLGHLAAGATTLSGPKVVARNCQGKQVSSTCMSLASPGSTGRFDSAPDLSTSTTDRFGEVNAYYQADRFSSWLETLSPTFQAGGGLGIVDVFTNVGGYEGAFFDSSGPFSRFGVRLGQGPIVDWAYDADILWHELGHGMVERTSRFRFYSKDAMGIYGDSGSLNEGTADCVSIAYKGSPQLGEHLGSRLMEAGQVTTPYIRSLEAKQMCQIDSIGADTIALGGRVGEIHADGVIWGSFFWALRRRLESVSTTNFCTNCNAADVALVRAMSSLGSGASFREATLAVQQVTASVFGAQAAQLVGCMSCEWDMAGCEGRTRTVYPGETHEALLVDSAAGSYGGLTPSTFQYVLAVPANTVVTFNRMAIATGSLTLLARFGQKIQWSGTGHNATHTITAQGQQLPAQPTAGNWYIQGAHNGAEIRRFGFRVNFVPSTSITRPPPSTVSCSLGGTIPSGCACTPQCTGKTCGSDGCGGTCGTCASGQTCSLSSQCGCAPQCAGKRCGPDGCGGSCGMCASGESCSSAGACVCVPSCSGRVCGSDGCGGSCGACPTNQYCKVGACTVGTDPCEGKQCGSDGAGGECGTCPTDFVCTSTGACSSAAGVCRIKLCGPDGLGGSCGTCTADEVCTDSGTCDPKPTGCGCTTGGEASLLLALAAWLARRRFQGRHCSAI